MRPALSFRQRLLRLLVFGNLSDADLPLLPRGRSDRGRHQAGRGEIAFSALGSRIQSLNKELGTTVLVCGATCARLASPAGCTPLADRQVKGHSAAVSVYALV